MMSSIKYLSNFTYLRLFLPIFFYLNARANGAFRSLVIGAEKVWDVNDHLHQILIKDNSNDDIKCGGVIIDHFFAITAAHCVDFDEDITKNFVVGYKSIYIDKVTYLPIEQIFFRNETNNDVTNPITQHDNDIALIKVKKAFDGGKIGIDSNIADLTECTITGWGVIDPIKQTRSNTLLKLTVVVNNSDSCRKFNLTENMLCSEMTSQYEYKRAANGDSGGPLVCNGKLAGLISAFDDTTNITIYTKVGNYDYKNLSEWITSEERKRLLNQIGQSDLSVQGLISNGKEATDDKFNACFWYMVYLTFTNEKNERDIKQCGGVIIGKNLILTAAHCFNPTRLLVKIIPNYNNVREVFWNDSVPFKKVYIHNNYNSTEYYDIAVIETENESFKKFLEISNSGVDNSDKCCTISGWGITEKTQCNNETFQIELRKLNYASVPIKILDEDKSMLYYHNSSTDASSTDANSCIGDSGGPLVCDNKLFGIVSSEKNSKSLYTNVVHYDVLKNYPNWNSSTKWYSVNNSSFQSSSNWYSSSESSTKCESVCISSSRSSSYQIHTKNKVIFEFLSFLPILFNVMI